MFNRIRSWTRTGAALGLGLLTASGAAAQGATPQGSAAPAMRQVEFDAAVAEAIAKNPTIAGAATGITRAEALLQQARAVTRPAFSANVQTVTLDAERGFNGGVTQPQSQATFNVSAAVPMLAPARWAAIAQARDQIDVSRLSVADVRQQIGVAAAQAYLAIIANRRQVEVSERALADARAHLDYAQKRLEGGAGSRLNQLRAAQQVSSEELRLENERLALRRAQEALGVLLVEDEPVDAGAEPTLEAAGPITEAGWMGARPDVQAQQAVIRAAQRTVRDSRLDWFPSATAAFTPQYVAPAGLFQPSRTWAFTVSFSQPIFDAGQRRATAALRQVALTQSQLQLTSVEVQARSDVRLAQASVESSTRALASARLAADQANEVLQITTSAFQVGATTNIEVIDAQRSALDANTTAAITEDALRRARLDLLVAIGQFPR
jgi:outer membrane protein TolC